MEFVGVVGIVLEFVGVVLEFVEVRRSAALPLTSPTDTAARPLTSVDQRLGRSRPLTQRLSRSQAPISGLA